MKNNYFKDKKVIITGHTGFKGSWLSAWLSELGARIIGVSDNVPTSPAHYDLVKEFVYEDHRIDVKDSNKIFSLINENKPSLIFHLAAQPIVIESYNNPLNTFLTNTIGTANLLDALRKSNHECVVVMITSDKCYDNVEIDIGYKETDRLGGKDPYSGSKGAAELVIRSYVQSFFINKESNVRVAVGRAGNVIGGGDWASYRIVPDCVRSWSKNKKAELRNPKATRPWQHVLEAVGGYLCLAMNLSFNKYLHAEAFNFGPNLSREYSVLELVKTMDVYWKNISWKIMPKSRKKFYESELLRLNCNKAKKILKWKNILRFSETVEMTTSWYRSYYENSKNIDKITRKQIREYEKLLKKRFIK